jgi:hypothetical protein
LHSVFPKIDIYTLSFYALLAISQAFRLFEGTVARKRKQKEKNGKEGLAVNVKQHPTNSGNKGNARRSLRKDTTAKKTWVDVVKARGINV